MLSKIFSDNNLAEAFFYFLNGFGNLGISFDEALDRFAGIENCRVVSVAKAHANGG